MSDLLAMCLILRQTRKCSVWVSASVWESISQIICPHTHTSTARASWPLCDWSPAGCDLYELECTKSVWRCNSNGIILRWTQNSHLILEILYSRRVQGNQLHPNEKNQRDASSHNKSKKGQLAWATPFVLSGTHLASINPIPSSLAFVSLRKRDEECDACVWPWAFRAVAERRAALRRSDSCSAHLVAFVSFFTLQKTQTPVSPWISAASLKQTLVLYLCRLIVPFLLWHHGLPGNRNRHHIRIEKVDEVCLGVSDHHLKCLSNECL